MNANGYQIAWSIGRDDSIVDNELHELVEADTTRGKCVQEIL